MLEVMIPNLMAISKGRKQLGSSMLRWENVAKNETSNCKDVNWIHLWQDRVLVAKFCVSGRVCGLPEKAEEYWCNQAINNFSGRVLFHVVICIKVPGHGTHAHALRAYKGSRITDPPILYIGTNCR